MGLDRLTGAFEPGYALVLFWKIFIELVKEIKKLNQKLGDLNREVFSAKEAAEYLRIGYDTILRLARINQIEHVKNGSSYIFRKAYLDRWLDKNKNNIKWY